MIYSQNEKIMNSDEKVLKVLYNIIKVTIIDAKICLWVKMTPRVSEGLLIRIPLINRGQLLLSMIIIRKTLTIPAQKKNVKPKFVVDFVNFMKHE